MRTRTQKSAENMVVVGDNLIEVNCYSFKQDGSKDDALKSKVSLVDRRGIKLITVFLQENNFSIPH